VASICQRQALKRGDGHGFIAFFGRLNRSACGGGIPLTFAQCALHLVRYIKISRM
jgi:hypothetical protein